MECAAYKSGIFLICPVKVLSEFTFDQTSGLKVVHILIFSLNRILRMKIKSAALFTTLLASSVMSYAGDMGPVKTFVPQNTYYVEGEAAYTWTSVGSLIVNGVTLPRTYDGWGGRIAAGAMHPLNETWRTFAEVGWGYFDSAKAGNSTIGSTTNDYNYGADLLVGLDYRFSQIDIFGGFGAMLQAINTHTVNDSSHLFEGSTITGVNDLRFATTTVSPELRVGGVYNFTENLGALVTYNYTFGNTLSLNSNTSVTGTAFHNALSVVGQPLEKSTIWFGLRYSFA